jgi:hypothetical protein
MNAKNEMAVLILTLFLLMPMVSSAKGGINGSESHQRTKTFLAKKQSDKQNYQFEARAFYGDKVLDRVVVIDVPKMQLVGTVDTIGKTPYPVDQAGKLDKVYAITRGSASVDVITADTLENLGVIDLEHKPRSGESYNARLGLTLIAGANKPLTSVIEVMNDMVVAVAGKDIETEQTRDNGGTLSSGHPAWFSKNRFAVIDRANRLIQLYGIEKIQKGNLDYAWEVTLLDEVSTPTSVHHILHRNISMLTQHEKREFYALAEGSAGEGIHPAILKLYLSNNDRLTLVDQVNLDHFDAAIMSSHHADFHPDGVHIYAGSAEGHLFVINRLTMRVEKVIKTGKGTGHTRFVPARNLAIITNHNDTFLTVVDSELHEKIKDVIVSGDNTQGQIMQSHTNFVSPDSKYYYAFASDNGVFFELNLKSLRVGRTLITGGAPVQGAFINWDDMSYAGDNYSSGM